MKIQSSIPDSFDNSSSLFPLHGSGKAFLLSNEPSEIGTA